VSTRTNVREISLANTAPYRALARFAERASPEARVQDAPASQPRDLFGLPARKPLLFRRGVVVRRTDGWDLDAA
jgi:hypothetical protein